MAKAVSSLDLESALPPLPAVGPYSGRRQVGHIIKLQAARPESWREAWPDDTLIIQVRDRLTALFRRAYHFEADSFLPNDPMGAILAVACPSEFDDLVEFIMSVEEELNVKIDDEHANKVKTSTTYLQFIELLLPQLSPEYILRPLLLPDYFFKSGRWASFRRWLAGRRYHNEFRVQQAWRTPDWVEKWADYEPLADLRDQVARILVEHLDWPTPAFVPEDQLAALLFHHQEGPKKLLRTVQALNQQFDADLTPDFPAADRSFLSLLQYIDRNSK